MKSNYATVNQLYLQLLLETTTINCTYNYYWRRSKLAQGKDNCFQIWNKSP